MTKSTRKPQLKMFSLSVRPEFEVCDDYCALNPYDPICYDPGDEGDTFCLDNPELCDDQEFDYGEYDEFEEFGDEFDYDSCQAELDHVLDLLEYLFSDGDYDDDGDADAPNYDGTVTGLPGQGTLGDLTSEAKKQAAARLLTQKNVTELKAKVLAANNGKATAEAEKNQATTELDKALKKVKRFRKKLKKKRSGR